MLSLQVFVDALLGINSETEAALLRAQASNILQSGTVGSRTGTLTTTPARATASTAGDSFGTGGIKLSGPFAGGNATGGVTAGPSEESSDPVARLSASFAMNSSGGSARQQQAAAATASTGERKDKPKRAKRAKPINLKKKKKTK